MNEADDNQTAPELAIPNEQLVNKISEGFMTCNSKPGGPYTVEIQCESLVDAQELHRLLCALKAY